MIIRSITLLATAAVWVSVTAATAPGPELPTLHVEWVHPQEDQPGWDCHTMGNRVCGPQSYDLTHEDTGDNACWVEKITRAETAEVICGPRGQRPAYTADIGQVFAKTTFDPCGWVASGPFVDGYTIDPAGCN